MNESMLLHSSDCPFLSYQGDLSANTCVTPHTPNKKKKNVSYKHI